MNNNADPSLKACTASVLCAADIKVGARGPWGRAVSAYLSRAGLDICLCAGALREVALRSCYMYMYFPENGG